MVTYYDTDLTEKQRRLFPYAAGASDQSGYVDFVGHPELIEATLEDFRPHADEPAIQTFYRMLRWINGTESKLMTADCALRTPKPHADSNSHHRLRVHSRLYVLFRDLHLNASAEHTNWLCGRFMCTLSETDPEFPAYEAVVAFTMNRAMQIATSNGTWLPGGRFETQASDPGEATHLTLTFFCYGDTADAAFLSLGRSYENVWEAAKIVSSEIVV